MSATTDLTRHFEAILGRELTIGNLGVVVLRERVASATKDAGSTTSRDIGTTGNTTKQCADATLLDVAGGGVTGPTGEVSFLLSEFFCDFSGVGTALNFEFPANLVATARTTTPAFLTGVAAPTADRRDVSIRVLAWDANGSPAARVPFDWRCRVPYTLVVD